MKLKKSTVLDVKCDVFSEGEINCEESRWVWREEDMSMLMQLLVSREIKSELIATTAPLLRWWLSTDLHSNCLLKGRRISTPLHGEFPALCLIL